MKKLFVVILTALLCLTGCGAQNPPANDEIKENTNSTLAAETETEAETEAEIEETKAPETEKPAETEPPKPAETYADHVIAPVEGEVIISLFNPNDISEWLDNYEGAMLMVEERGNVPALIHCETGTSISFKKKFNVDWSKYERENIYIAADIFVNADPGGEYKGSLKIKNGDRDDQSGNTSENNQLNFDVTKMNLKAGWNSFVFPLSEASPDKGDDYTIADWFCLWINNLDDAYEFGIGRLDIVYNPAG